MRGTEKQINWATAIRRRAMEDMQAELDNVIGLAQRHPNCEEWKEQVEFFQAAIKISEETDEAGSWIDHRSANITSSGEQALKVALARKRGISPAAGLRTIQDEYLTIRRQIVK